jgi:hypothetical protein
MTSSDESLTSADGADTRTDQPERYRCLDYTAYYAGDDFKLFESPVTGARHVLPAISEQLLKPGDRFRTLDEHASIICLAPPFREVPVEAIRELLAGLASADLLISHRDLAARCAQLIGDHHPARIGVVGIPTCNRPGGLQRVVTSAIENARRHDRQVVIAVADDSDETHESENLAVLAELGATYGTEIWHAGPREKAAFAQHLADQSGVPLATVNIALCHAPGWPGAPGANRNALLLHAIGEAFLTLDDDMDLRVARLPEDDDGLALTSSGDPTQSWFYPSPAATLAATRFVDEDFVGLHESLLGFNVGRLAAERMGDRPLDLDRLSSHFLANLVPDGGAVTYTMAGVLGDSGLKESLPFFFADGPSLERLLSAKGGHRGAMASRQMARGVLRTTVSDSEFCMGANIGLDNRGLLPPFQTAARNEDGIFSVLVRGCIPSSFIGFLPRTVLHDPVVPRQFPVDRFQETVGVLEAADAIQHLIWSWPQPPGRSTTRRRLVSLGSFLIELGELEAVEFETRLRQIWLTLCSSEAAYIEKALRQQGPGEPTDWSTDLRRYLDTLIERLESDAPVSLRELEGRPPEEARGDLQRYLRDFGGLLCAWPDLVEAARDLRCRGIRLGRRVMGDG